MKTIRTIKYIDMFVPTIDHHLDYLIDITVEPYYFQVSDLNQNILNIFQIIYKKSLDYGFKKLEAIEFGKRAVSSHLEGINISKKSKDEILQKSIEKIIDIDPNQIKIDMSKVSDSEFIVVKNDDSEITIHDYDIVGIEILKHLVDLEAKMICYNININQKIIKISFLDFKNKFNLITDLKLSTENIKFIQENINTKKKLLDITMENEEIQIFFLEKEIFNTKDCKLNIGETDDINDSTTIDSDESSNIIESFDNSKFISKDELKNSKTNLKSTPTPITNKNNNNNKVLLVNPIILRRK